MLAAVHHALRLIPDKVNDLQVSAWAESRRSLPSVLTVRPGPFRWSNAPYFREVVDCLSESSDVREVVVMKGARIGYNVDVIENHMGYMIEMCPGPAMFVGANKEQAQTVTEIRVDRMLETCGLAGRITSQTTKRANKKTGDSKSKKEFPGGYLLIGGPSGPFLRGTDARYLYLDELDEWKLQIGAADKKKGVTANQGDPVALARRRTGTYSSSRKIVYGSTPLDDSTSKIKELFLEGDQCRYFVPCPKCGRMQVLAWRDDKRDGDDRFRMKYEADSEGRLLYDKYHEGKPVAGTGRVWYECEDKECRHKWREWDKQVFLENGEWRPGEEKLEDGRIVPIVPRTPFLRSFHISSLYSVTEPWESIALEWLKVGDDQTKLRSFINTFLGETWKEKSTAPSVAVAKSRQQGYKSGTLPTSARPIVVTVGADIQADRIAAEVVAWGRGMESWSIKYIEIPGQTDDMNSDAWWGLKKLIEEEHAGHPVFKALIDAHYNSSQVHGFCEQNFPDGVRAVLGYDEIRGDRGARYLYRMAETRGIVRQRVDLNVTEIKLDFYNKLSIGLPKGGTPDDPLPGYCHFPDDRSQHYYNMLTSEDRVWRRGPTGRSTAEWVQHGHNEALDCRAYASGCIFFAYGERWKEMQADAPEGEEIRYTWDDFWDELAVIFGKK